MQLQKVEQERHELTRRTSELEGHVQQLTKRVNEVESVKKESHSAVQSEEQLAAENSELKKLLNDNNRKMRELEEELLHIKNQCLDQVIDSQVSASELRQDVEQSRKRIANDAGVQRAENLRAHQDMVNRMIQMGEKSRESDQSTKKLQGEDRKLAAEMVSKIQKLGDQEQQDLIHGTLKALELENQVLNMRNAQLEREALKELSLKVDERKSLIGGIELLDKKNEAVKTEDDMDNLLQLTDVTPLNQDYENQIAHLQKQAVAFKEEIQRYEKKCSDLKLENSELEEIVTDVFKELQGMQKSPEATPSQNKTDSSSRKCSSQSLKLMENVKGLGTTLSNFKMTVKSLRDEKKCLQHELEATARVIQDLEVRVASAEEERRSLEVSMEELDQQHQDAVDKLIGLRNAELSENTELKSHIMELKSAATHKPHLSECCMQTEGSYIENILKDESTQTDYIHQCDQEIQAALNSDEEMSANVTERKILNIEADSFKYDSELSEKIKKLVNFDLPNDFNNSIPQSVYLVQEIVKIVNDCKWKKDTLERKIAELSRENMELDSTNTILEAENSNLKENVERLAEQLVGVAKSCKDPLPTIIENCEETEQLEQKVAVLEEEVAVLRETRVNLEEDAARMREEREELIGRIRNTEAELRNKENLVTELQHFVEDLNSSLHSIQGAADLAVKERISAEDKAKFLGQELEITVQNFEKQLHEIKELSNNLEINNNELIEDVNKKNAKLKECQNYISELELEQKSLSAELKVNVSSLEEAKLVDAERRALQIQAMNLQKQLSDMIDVRARLTTVSDDLKMNIKAKLDLQHQLEEARKTLHNAEVLSKDKEELEAEVKKWQSIAASEGEKMTDTLASVMKLEEENKILREKLEKEEVTAANLALKNEQHLKEIDELKGQLEKELTKENTRQLFEDLQIKHHSEITTLKNDKNQVEQSLSLAVQQHNLSKQEVESLQALLFQKEQSEAQLQQTVSNLNVQLTSLETNVKKSKDELMENMKKFEEERQKLYSKISSLEQNEIDVTQVKEKVHYLEAHVHILLEEKESLMEDNSKLKSALSNNCGSKFHNISHKISTLQNDIPLRGGHSMESHSTKSKEMKQKDKQLSLTSLEEKTREIYLLHSRLKDLTSKLEENYETVRKLEQEKENIANEKSQCEEKFVMTKETVLKLSEMIKEKDQELDELKGELLHLRFAAQRSDHIHHQLARTQESSAQIVQERDQLLQTVHVKHQESLQYHAEIQRLSALLTQELAKNQQLASQCASLAQQCEEKANQREVQDLQEALKMKDEGLQQLIKRLGLQEQELQARGLELEALQHQMELMAQGKAAHMRAAASSLQEEDIQEKYKEIQSKFQDEQRKGKNLQNELENCQGRELALQRELERLRIHLVEIEDTYTQEALKSEERVKELLSKLQQAEEMMKSSSTVYKSANIRANQQVETLQEQARLIAQQRDDVQLKLSAAEDQVAKHSAALRNLQAVLEQFQRDREREIEAARASVYKKVEAAQQRHNELLGEISSLKLQLKEASEGLSAASRLGEELERKTETVNRLKQEVVHLEGKVLKAEGEAKMVGQTVEGKVDKSLVKNVVLGFFLAPPNSKEQVLHVVASVLDFNEEEKRRIQKRLGLHGSDGSGGWFKSLLHPSGPDQSNSQSLSEAFVRFLENESIPQPKLKMLPDSEKQASSSSKGPGAGPAVSMQRKSPLLLADVQLPTFAQFPVGRNSSSILKDILKES